MQTGSRGAVSQQPQDADPFRLLSGAAIVFHVVRPPWYLTIVPPASIDAPGGHGYTPLAFARVLGRPPAAQRAFPIPAPGGVEGEARPVGGDPNLAEVRVGENETFESALRRFNKKIQQSGILAEARRREHYEKPSVKRKRKEAKRKKVARQA